MCSHGVISRSDLRFSLLQEQPIRTCTPDPFLRLTFTTHLPKPRVSSLKTRATINDGPVTSSPPPSPTTAEMMSFYELLGISETGTLLDIKQAYKQLARKYHPDVSPPGLVEEYTQRFILVQEAYETLSDPSMRALYDRDMARGIHLAFSARRSYQSDEQMEDRSEWKNRWQTQLSELKRRSMSKDTGENMSWGARMRMQRNESSTAS
ncbi:chaperone protein dnaJ 20, chloroplastic-like [Cornus florida]|uniref:chaperone protein dnaJ 20, chloroplastic-like n=1 Tax=Cornus florida TaxID=4283 RepID=UPI002896E53E|nr:chaperone protein dnaJ 20, chloroplastic-like [Cornus florida]